MRPISLDSQFLDEGKAVGGREGGGREGEDGEKETSG